MHTTMELRMRNRVCKECANLQHVHFEEWVIMSEKPQLPFGWVVKQSKSYPDRVYYFNINSGASTWEFPDLIKDYSVNPDAAGPVSPPILSASLLSAGPSPPAVQGLQKQAQEPTFSPQFSEDDSPSDNSPSPFGAERHTKLKLGPHMESKKYYGKPNYQASNTYHQTQVPRNVQDPRNDSFPRAVPDHRTNMQDPRNMAGPRNMGKQISGQVQQRNFDPKGVTFSNRPGLLGASPYLPNDAALKAVGYRVDNGPGKLGEHRRMPYETNRPLHVDVAPGTQSFLSLGNSGTLPRKTPLFPTPSPKTPDKCSNLQKVGSKASAEKNSRSFGASGSKYYNNESKIKTSVPLQQDRSSVTNKGLPNSGLINNPYSKGLQILNKSAQKSLAQLGQIGNVHDTKTDKSNTIKSDTSLSKPKSVPSSVSDRETLERELNKSLNKDLKERQALEKALNKPLDINLKQREELARELNKSVERDLNDNITKTGKRKLFDVDKGESEKKRTKYDKTDNSGVKSDTKSRSPTKKSESKTVKRKSSEILKRDGLRDDLNDRRKVIKGSVKDTISRNVILKTTPVKFGANSTVSEDLKVQTTVCLSQQKAPSSSRSFTRQVSEDSNLSLELPEDPDQSGILRQFIGDKDKLLSIQSWIDNIRDGAGSSTASVESLSESLSGDADDKRVVVSDKSTDCDSGYLSPPVKQPVTTVRGWPGEVKKSDISSREISAMEIDDVELPESNVKFEEEDMVVDLMLSQVREEMKSNPEKVCGTLTATVAEIQQFMQEQTQLERANISVVKHSEINRQLYVVIDTNVIISDLPFVQDLKDQEITGYGKPVLYIPWIVLQELDALKQACTKGMPKLTAATQNKATRGIKMLQAMLRMKHPQVKGQTPMESQEAARMFRATCNDDVILMSCLHYKENNPAADIVLLSNDNNLINKALVCGVDAYNRKELLCGLNKVQQKISLQANRIIPRSSLTPNKGIPGAEPSHSTPTPSWQTGYSQGPSKAIPGLSTSGAGTSITQNLLVEEKCYTVEKLTEDIQCKFKCLLKAGLGKVLQTEMELAYSDMWQEIVLRKPPWSLRDILESVKKHWIAVFGMVFPRPLSQNIDYLTQTLKDEKVFKIEEVSVCIEEALFFLQKCVQRNVYGSAFVGVVDRVQQLSDLCGSVIKGEIDVETISSLEDYLQQQQQSSQPQRICDNYNDNTNLVNDIADMAGKNDNSSQFTPAGRNDVTVTSSAQSTGNLSIHELAARKLQKIWQHIYTCCDEMRKLLNSGMGVTVLSAVEATLSLLVPAAKQIRTEYAVVLQLPLSHLPGHMDKIGNLANQCNNFFSCLQLNDEDPPVDAEHFLALFRNGQQRESLSLFLSQLDEMLCHLYKCVHYLDEGNKDGE